MTTEHYTHLVSFSTISAHSYDGYYQQNDRGNTKYNLNNNNKAFGGKKMKGREQNAKPIKMINNKKSKNSSMEYREGKWTGLLVDGFDVELMVNRNKMTQINERNASNIRRKVTTKVKKIFDLSSFKICSSSTKINGSNNRGMSKRGINRKNKYGPNVENNNKKNKHDASGGHSNEYSQEHFNEYFLKSGYVDKADINESERLRRMEIAKMSYLEFQKLKQKEGGQSVEEEMEKKYKEITDEKTGISKEKKQKLKKDLTIQDNISIQFPPHLLKLDNLNILTKKNQQRNYCISKENEFKVIDDPSKVNHQKGSFDSYNIIKDDLSNNSKPKMIGNIRGKNMDNDTKFKDNNNLNENPLNRKSNNLKTITIGQLRSLKSNKINSIQSEIDGNLKQKTDISFATLIKNNKKNEDVNENDNYNVNNRNDNTKQKENNDYINHDNCNSHDYDSNNNNHINIFKPKHYKFNFKKQNVKQPILLIKQSPPKYVPIKDNVKRVADNKNTSTIVKKINQSLQIPGNLNIKLDEVNKLSPSNSQNKSIGSLFKNQISKAKNNIYSINTAKNANWSNNMTKKNDYSTMSSSHANYVTNVPDKTVLPLRKKLNMTNHETNKTKTMIKPLSCCNYNDSINSPLSMPKTFQNQKLNSLSPTSNDSHLHYNRKKIKYLTSKDFGFKDWKENREAFYCLTKSIGSKYGLRSKIFGMNENKFLSNNRRTFSNLTLDTIERKKKNFLQLVRDPNNPYSVYWPDKFLDSACQMGITSYNTFNNIPLITSFKRKEKSIDEKLNEIHQEFYRQKQFEMSKLYNKSSIELYGQCRNLNNKLNKNLIMLMPIKKIS